MGRLDMNSLELGKNLQINNFKMYHSKSGAINHITSNLNSKLSGPFLMKSA
jgi:hypothetical protein